jgi:hypothetical protein
MPSYETINTKLTHNILIIQMSKIPLPYHEQFNAKYFFTTYNSRVELFERVVETIHPKSSGTKQHSADDVLLKKKTVPRKRQSE